MRSRLVPPIVLLLLLAILQWQLWNGRGSVRDVAQLQSKLADQKAANAKAVVNNERLASEVNDLKIGLEMVEERARQELGMVKPNEVFVQVTH
ncbi:MULTISPECIES: septum formation initiator family protein [Variovorax]|jgi:cell division protein FtsB|uniref:Cell division protein FtsB n=2 Tax=Variovorax TaxID=34072 RepID=A0AAE3Y5C8_VARPD|nr:MULTISPECIES: septum formation initiator family protein [Variovorax]MBD9667981.1 septum formation initiator family protein [Variovorax sp. VRV01]MDP9968408.1 cell division protein FtsB [Variovorax paradoxus]MDR6429870.1 cell division protein FtsB [Variovorax paradoxus]MDR6456611.1 cell division protein FtsB [Variovorax paradoxus]TWD75694.1 cell division protein FtsB [Variovorax beijingensis]